MAKNDKNLEKTVEKTAESAAKQEFEISEVFRGAHVDESQVMDFYNQAISNPQEARNKLMEKIQETEALRKRSEDLMKNITYYTDKLNTGFDIKTATRWQRTLYGAAKLIPVQSWRESAKQKVADSHKVDILDNIITALNELNSLTVTTDGLIKNGSTQHGQLRNLANNDYLKQQDTAVKAISVTAEKVMKYTKDVKDLEAQIAAVKGQEDKKQDYIKLKGDLGRLEDTLYLTKQDLVKRTIDYNVAEDCFYQAEVMLDKLKNGMSVVDIKNYEVKRTVTEISKLMPAKTAIHKIIEAGEGLVTLKEELTNILRQQEIAESEKLKYMAEIVASDVQSGVYAPIIPLQIELNEETKRIIEATHAYVVQVARSGVRQKMVEELKEKVKQQKEETPYQK